MSTYFEADAAETLSKRAISRFDIGSGELESMLMIFSLVVWIFDFISFV